MRIERLNLIAYGRFSDVSLDMSAGPRRLHIVYGPNESGKSTSLRAITALLFGMESRTNDDFVHPMRDLRVGGRLVSGDGAVLECTRRKGTKKTLLACDGKSEADEGLLQRMLGGIDKAAFLSQFGLTHEALVQGGRAITEGGGDLGEILFAAGAGVGRLREIQEQLEKEHKALFLPARGIKPSLNQRFSQLAALRKRLVEAQLRPADYKRRCAELQSADDEAKRQTADFQQRQRHIGRLEAYRDALPLIGRRRVLQQQLHPLCNVPLLDDDFVQRRRKADTALGVASERRRSLETRVAALAKQIQSLPECGDLLQHATLIEGLFRQLGAREKALADLPGIEKRRDHCTSDIREILLSLSQTPATEDLESLRIAEPLRMRVHELSGSFGRLQEQLEAAEREHAALEDELARATSALRQAEQPPDPAALAAALQRMGNPQRLLDQQAEAEEQLATLTTRAEAAVRQLPGFRGTFRQAIELSPPAGSTARRVAQLLDQTSHQRDRHEERLVELREQAEAAETELDSLCRGQAIPCEAELEVARAQRDAALDALTDPTRGADASTSDASTDGRLATLRQMIAAADQLADRLRREAERVARRADAEAQLESIRRRITATGKQRDAAAKAHVQAVADWKQMWESAGLAPLAPEATEQWYAQFEQLRVMEEDLARARRAVQTAQQAVSRAAADVAAAVAATAPCPVEAFATVTAEATSSGAETLFPLDEPVDLPLPTDLVALHDAARDQLERLQQARGRHDALCDERLRLERAMPRVKADLQTRRETFRRWNQHWTEVTRQIAASDSATPTGVLRVIERIDEIFAKKRERDDLQQRIDGIEHDAQCFADEVAAVVRSVAPELASATPHQATQQLIDRLCHHRSVEEKRNTLREQQREAERELQIASDRAQDLQAELERLAHEAKCASVDELPEVEQLSLQRSRLESELRSIEQQLSILAAREDLEAFVQSALQHDAVALESEIDQQRSLQQTQQQQLDVLRERLGTLRRDVATMDGSCLAAELQQEMQDLLARIRRDAMQYATLRIASVALEGAIERYRQEHQGPVLQRAEQLFGCLTCGDYRSLRAEYDEKGKPILWGIRQSGSVPANLMSEGTADALYLALRLASLEMHLAGRATVPLVVDDILIQFDDARAAAALRILSELSLKTQIIFFTHHQHLLDLAAQTLESTDYHVHRLLD